VPTDIPVEAPNKLQCAIDLRTSKALGLVVRPILAAQADVGIEWDNSNGCCG
jgi:hypothetical protein